ncbi:MAG: DUF3189 family protein [Bacillota bacterium]|nr:DUF3189 family protein [Bacillota bacterium]
MVIIYHSPFEPGPALLAAALHLNLFSHRQRPSLQSLRLLLQEKEPSYSPGALYLLGTDRQGNRVYILARGSLATLAANAIHSLFELYGQREHGRREEVLLAAISAPRWLPALGANALAVYLFWNYFRLVRLVEKVEEGAQQRRNSGG